MNLMQGNYGWLIKNKGDLDKAKSPLFY